MQENKPAPSVEVTKDKNLAQLMQNQTVHEIYESNGNPKLRRKRYMSGNRTGKQTVDRYNRQIMKKMEVSSNISNLESFLEKAKQVKISNIPKMRL